MELAQPSLVVHSSWLEHQEPHGASPARSQLQTLPCGKVGQAPAWGSAPPWAGLGTNDCPVESQAFDP
ncbi:hypothetical protein Y1Q_0001858 [Alligator mississippiensis]|uniref:Uncharacterized protein n=1 Tax=Alligator mississippiensis TaxID=8496 RepID=A0A151PG86_ALLMI|nr:hypothetical protein Y1Q_0001858 [Alligator mississippiensis]